MPRDSRETRNALPRLNRRFARFTLGLLLFLVMASGIFAYQVSPLRDPSFQIDLSRGNAGSLLPWMHSVSDQTWDQASFVLAGLLSINLSVVFWQGIEPKRTVASQFFQLMCCVWGSVVIFFLLKLTFLWYLLGQWLVD